MSEVKIPITLESYDPEIEDTLTGDLTLTKDTLYLDLTDGRKVAIDMDERGLRVYAWVPEVDAPVSMAIQDKVITLDTHDYLQDGGVLNRS